MTNLEKKVFLSLFLQNLLNEEKVFFNSILKRIRFFFRNLVGLFLLCFFGVSYLNAQVSSVYSVDRLQKLKPPVNANFPLITSATLNIGNRMIVVNAMPPNDPNYILNYGGSMVKAVDLNLIGQIQFDSTNYFNGDLYGNKSSAVKLYNKREIENANYNDSKNFEYAVPTINIPLNGITNVTGTNYNENLTSSTAQDVYVNSIAVYNPCNNAVTGGNFGNPPGNYTVVGPWTPVNSGEIVKIVEEGTLRGAAIKKDLYSLKQQIQSIKTSTTYTLSMIIRRWTGSPGCNPNSNASYRFRVYDPANPAVYFLNITNTTNNDTPIVFNQTFTTSAITASLILEIEEANSANVGCPIFVDDISINSPIVISPSSTNVTCNGANNGTIKVTELSGAAAPYQLSYSTDGGNSYSTTQNSGPISTSGTPFSFPVLLVPGNYKLKIVDANGCINTRDLTISEPPIITLSETHIDNSCNNNAVGVIDLTVNGGTSPYTYVWVKDGSYYTSVQDINNLLPGRYTVTVTDFNNCQKQLSVDILPLTPFALSNNQVNNTCNGASLGSITLSASGGKSPYSYIWSNGSNNPNQTNLSAGTYTVIGKDALGCEIPLSFTITAPTILTLTATNTAILCNGGTSIATLTATGGTGNYQYSLDGIAFQASGSFANLSVGEYTFIVRDANGCLRSSFLSITQPAALSLATSTKSDALCNGASTGTITAGTVTNSVGTVNYSWKNSSNTLVGITPTVNNLPAGIYTLTVTDDCFTRTNEVAIAQPSALILASSTKTDALCNGASTGTITAGTVTNSVGTVNYSWKNSSNTLVGITPTVNNLPAGIYTLTVTDNCFTRTNEVTIAEPATLSSSATQTHVNCFGENTGSIDLVVTGGTAPYTFVWSNSATTEDLTELITGTYSVTITDSKGCSISQSVTITQPMAILSATLNQINVKCFGESTGEINLSIAGGTSPYTFVWSNSATTEDLTALIAGNYSVTVTDANQCTITKTILISQPAAALNITDNHQNVKCFGEASGSINISVSGGTAPYTYSWNNGINTEDLSALIAGNYTITVIDANNCSANKNVIINQPASALAATEIHQDINCFGVASGSIDISVSGGTAPYAYAWNNNAATQDLSALPAGNYSVNINDANGCKISVNVLIQQPLAPLSMVENHQDIKCFGDATGNISLALSGGTAPYTYLWSNGATTKDLNNKVAGIYNVVVSDAKGCTIGKQIQIIQPDAPLIITEALENVKCFGEATGKINLTISGGTAPYTYLWGNGTTTQNLTNLSVGIYTLKVTDRNGCITNKQIQITQPVAPLFLSETHANNVCFGDKIGAINVTVSGGTAPYTYKWNTGQITKNLSNLDAGVYQLIVTDANNCTQTISATITPLQAFVVTENMQNVKCFNESTGSISLNLVGGEAPYTINWSNGATGTQLSNLKAGNYTYKAVDFYGCIIQKTITITQPQALASTFTVTNTSCKFSLDGAIVLNITGGTAPFKYIWNGLNRGPNASLINITSGKYIITITDANGCSIFVTAEVLPGNCAPSADNDKYTTNEDTPIIIRTPGVIVNDTDPDQDEIKIMLNTVRDPNAPVGSVSGNVSSFNTLNGFVVINNDGSFTYTPKKNFAGIERFVYKVFDGSLLSNFATVTIEVLAVNDPPIAIDDNYSTPEDTPFDGTVIPNDSDPDGDILRYRLLAQPNNAVVSFNADGTFRFVPGLNFNGTITFDYQVCDPLGLCDTAKVTVVVTPVNDPPIALDDTFKTQINLPFNNRVIDNDTDPDNDPLQYTALSQPTNGTLIFNANGTFNYSPGNGFKGKDTFTYRACDPSGLCDNATVTILVQPIVTVNLTPGTGTIKEGDKISITAVLTESIFEDAIMTLAYGGSATNNADYSLTGNFITITIPAGQTTTTQQFTINAINDALKDDGEQVIANVSGTSTTFVLIGTGSVVNITDIYPTAIPLKPEENPDINPDPLTSPNGDGQGNDKFVIYNISKYPDNEVIIFNRWGNEVFKIAGYNNNDKAFAGIANVGILTNTNKELVDGVYYFVIYTTVDGVKKINRGYLILKR